MSEPPRLLIEDWLPAAAIGVECIRERSTGQQPPDKRLHVWWARRPLAVSRAAVLGSLLPADFPRDVFERLLGFGRPSQEIVQTRRAMDDGYQVVGGFGYERAFKRALREDDLALAAKSAGDLWGELATVLDPMAGGGSIPLEGARLGFLSMANEYNSVACTVLEATVDYPLRFGSHLAEEARKWAKVWEERGSARLAGFYPIHRFARVHAYVFARTVPCPDTGHATPLVTDWHLLKPASHSGCGPACTLAVPVVDKLRGSWRVEIKRGGRGAGQVRQAPPPTYDDGKGISLFTGGQIPSDYIKAKAQAGEMGSALLAVALKTPQGLEFRPPEAADLEALKEAECELRRLRPGWEKANIIPTELVAVGDKTGEVLSRGAKGWSDLFSPRQLLCLGVLVQELIKLRPEIVGAEGRERGEAIVHLLAFVIDKFLNHNCYSSRWENTRAVMKGKMDRHDYAFKPAFAELAPCGSGAGLAWAIDNVLSAYEDLAKLPLTPGAKPARISLGSATSLPDLADGSITAVVVDPPYADNVQYSELADFFYVWLKRTQGHRRPEWFLSYLSEHDQEAVVNVARHRAGNDKAGEAKKEAHAFYQQLMTDVFRECHRVLRDDGVLTVMFTHKKQAAWEALFESLIKAGFAISATWPVKTESEHSLHQARKNAAQSTVILVTRKRPAGAGTGYFDQTMREEIRQKAREAAERLQREGLNPVDQLVGSFGPAMSVTSRYDEVRTDTGQPVPVSWAIDEASEAVSAWRVEQLAKRGLEGVEPEGRFYLLCWDVLGAYEFRFNEAHLLGKAVGMDVDRLVAAGLVSKSGDKVLLLSAGQRRRERALEPSEAIETLFGPVTVSKRVLKKDTLKVHPNDPRFRTALDGCQALALRYLEAGGGAAGLGAARALAHQQAWKADSQVARLMEALVRAAPKGVRVEKGANSAAAKFPEFRAWHALLKPLFGIEPPDWTEKPPLQPRLLRDEHAEYAVAGEADEESEEGEE